MFRKQWKDLNAKINQKLEEVGLSSQHVSYLITLSDNKDIKVKELNSLVGNDKALTTRVLTTLINNEFVAKTEENTRKCKLYLTKKGEEVINSLEKIFKSISNKFTKEDVFGLTNIKIN
jgi:DNA-binding MarR family transcriptional regulator